MIKLEINNEKAEQHFNAVKHLVIKKINDLLVNGTYYNMIHIYPDDSLEEYLYRLINPGDNLNVLITAEPPALIEIIGNLEAILNSPESVFILKKIFIDCYEKINKLNFVKIISIDTCPYCNRSYIYCLDKTNKIKPQIDHFYPKSKYPFLALSYYNLIPCCQTCNGVEAKGSIDPIERGLTNPYLIFHNDFEFKYDIKSSNIFNYLTDKESVAMIIKTTLTGHLEVFKLRELYEQHSDHVIELIIKKYMQYPESYIKSLNDDYNLSLKKSDINRMILGNYATEGELHKRPLAKLYYDIGKELGLI